MSPTYERLRELGASFGEKSGWERANWFEPNAAAGDEALRPRGWAGRLWSPAIGAEHRACREAAALFDETSFAKIEVSGAGAAEFLERLCDNRVARDVGQITYTQMLNPRGGIECDFTVTRLEDDRFRIVTGTAFGRHDLAWIAQHAPEDGSVSVDDVTARYACLGLWGPAAREILEAATATTSRSATCGPGRSRSPRCRAWRCASPTSASSAGSSTARSTRGSRSGTRSGRRAARTASSPVATRRSTRCGWRRATASGAPTSRPRTRRTRRGSASRSSSTRASSPVARRCSAPRSPSGGWSASCFAEPRAVALGSEPVRIEGELVGRVTSGGYGYTVERSIAYAYVPARHAEPGRRVEVEIFGEWVAGEVAPEPLFDPAGERLGADARSRWSPGSPCRPGVGTPPPAVPRAARAPLPCPCAPGP